MIELKVIENINYFLSNETSVITKDTGTKVCRETFFDFMSRNSERIARFFNLSTQKVCEIGTHIKL
ncbi:MAG: hypothetical protein IE931_02150 [Sphingobacteriales bacterium]|nr:hypothetical protein [Sphingobacteriales bacterium]